MFNILKYVSQYFASMKEIMLNFVQIDVLKMGSELHGKGGIYYL